MHACVAQRLNGLLDARARLGYLPVSNSKDIYNIATLFSGGFIKFKYRSFELSTRGTVTPAKI